MQEQVDIQLHLALEERHELMIVELSLEEVVEGNMRRRTGDLDGAHGALEEKDADGIRGDGQVDLVVLLLGISLVHHQHAFIGQAASGVFEGAEFGHPSCPLQFALVVVLLREGNEEAFFPVVGRFQLGLVGDSVSIVCVKEDHEMNIMGLDKKGREGREKGRDRKSKRE